MLEWQQHRKCDVVILAYMAFQQSFGQAIWHCTKPFHKACCSELDAFSTANQDSSLWFALLIVPAHLGGQLLFPPTHQVLHDLVGSSLSQVVSKIAIWMLPSKDGEIDHFLGQTFGCPHHHSKPHH